MYLFPYFNSKTQLLVFDLRGHIANDTAFQV
jgi:hypothetical protein